MLKVVMLLGRGWSAIIGAGIVAGGLVILGCLGTGGGLLLLMLCQKLCQELGVNVAQSRGGSLRGRGGHRSRSRGRGRGRGSLLFCQSGQESLKQGQSLPTDSTP